MRYRDPVLKGLHQELAVKSSRSDIEQWNYSVCNPGTVQKRCSMGESCSAVSWKSLSIAMVTLFVVLTARANATNHIIMFGGSLGLVYSPNSLSVLVGDTVTWEGDFSVHPLSSTSVPAGASSFHNTSGTAFSYVITVAGTYDYQCDVHFSLGMVGSFTATLTDVEGQQATSLPTVFKLEQNYPNPFNPSTEISFDLPQQSFVSLKVYSLLGQEVAALVDRTLTAGRHSVTWNAGSLPSGAYFCRLRAGSFTQTRRLVLLR